MLDAGGKRRPHRNMTPISPENVCIVIHKSRRKLQLLDGDRVVKSYDVVLGFSPEGDKEMEGDGRTPEGEFSVCVKNPQSRFRLSLGLNYPTAAAARRGLASGLIGDEELEQVIRAHENKRVPPQKTALGGEIYIHGGGTEGDWTKGCVALANADIEELFAVVPAGTKVVILP